MARKAKPSHSTMVSKMRKRASLSTSMAWRYSPRSEVSITSLRMSSIVCSTCTPSAVDRPTAGSASMARMRLPGKASTSSRTIAEHREVLPTPPLPATAMILAFVLFSSIVRSLLTAEKICGSCGFDCIHPTTDPADLSVSRSQTCPNTGCHFQTHAPFSLIFRQNWR